MKTVNIILLSMLAILLGGQLSYAQSQHTKDVIIDKTADKVFSIFDKKEKKTKDNKPQTGSQSDKAGTPKTTVLQVPKGSRSQTVNGKYVTSYKNLMLGDQRNDTYGQFFIISTGQCADVELAREMQDRAGLVLFREYGDNLLLTFPGNAREASAFKSEYDENVLFSEETGGVDSWSQEKIVTGDIDDCSMSAGKFEEIANQNTWKAFNSAFTAANGGSNSVGGIHYETPKNGTVYLIRFNNGTRALLLVKNVIASGSKSGSMKFDILVEGSETDR